MSRFKIMILLLVIACLTITQFAGAIDAASLKSFIKEYNESEEKTKWCWARLPYAIEKGHVDIAEYFILRNDPIMVYHEWWPSEVKSLRDPNNIDSYCKHPLLTAIRKGYVNLVVLMLQSGVNLSKVEEYKNIYFAFSSKDIRYEKFEKKQSLIIAVEESSASYEMVAVLLAAGVNANEGGYSLNHNPFIWRTINPLKSAIELKRLDIAELLLGQKAYVGDLLSSTALYWTKKYFIHNTSLHLSL